MFIRITPFMHVPDMDEALRFFTVTLGFPLCYREGSYAYVQREMAGFRLLEGKGADAPPPGTGRYAYYVDVHDVDALYAELKPYLDALAQGTVEGPVDRIYMQRELTVLAPDGNLLVFGHAIQEPGVALTEVLTAA